MGLPAVWIQQPARLGTAFAGDTTLGRVFHLSKSQFSHLENEGNNTHIFLKKNLLSGVLHVINSSHSHSSWVLLLSLSIDV